MDLFSGFFSTFFAELSRLREGTPLAFGVGLPTLSAALISS